MNWSLICVPCMSTQDGEFPRSIGTSSPWVQTPALSPTAACICRAAASDHRGQHVFCGQHSAERLCMQHLSVPSVSCVCSSKCTRFCRMLIVLHWRHGRPLSRKLYIVHRDVRKPNFSLVLVFNNPNWTKAKRSTPKFRFPWLFSKLNLSDTNSQYLSHSHKAF